jgi:beta-glucosidase-like glycosyl hydrolase
LLPPLNAQRSRPSATDLKHYTAYSTETNRGHDTYHVSPFDFWDSYLPQYEMAFRHGHASGVMCSYATAVRSEGAAAELCRCSAPRAGTAVARYNAENGRPSCANGYILNEVIRKKWAQPDAFVTTDCGAVSNMRGAPANAPTDMHAAAWTINNGTDLEMGSCVAGSRSLALCSVALSLSLGILVVRCWLARRANPEAADGSRLISTGPYGRTT